MNSKRWSRRIECEWKAQANQGNDSSEDVSARRNSSRRGIFEKVETSYNNKVAKQQEDTQKKAETYRSILRDATDFLALNFEPTSWSVNQLKAVLKPLKKKDYTVMPTLKAKLYERWLLWWGKIAPAMEAAEPLDGVAPLDGAVPVEEANAEDYGCSKEEGAIADMIILNEDKNVHNPFQHQVVWYAASIC